MQLIANALIAGSLAALIAGGLAVVYGVLGVFNLALGQTALLGGYVTWWLYQVAGMSLLPSIVGGLLAGALLSWGIYVLCVVPFVRQHRFLPLITTIGFSMVLDGALQLTFGESSRGIIVGGKRMMDLAGVHISMEQIVLVVSTVLALAAFAFIFHSTPVGRRIRAVVQHEHAAQTLGISTSSIRFWVFIVSGIFAAAGGIFIGIDQSLTPVFGFILTIKAYAAVIAGGKGSVWGAIVMAYVIALLEQVIVGVQWFGSFYVPAGYQQTVALVVIIVFLLIRPTGLFGSRLRIA